MGFNFIKQLNLENTLFTTFTKLTMFEQNHLFFKKLNTCLYFSATDYPTTFLAAIKPTVLARQYRLAVYCPTLLSQGRIIPNPLTY